MPKTATAMRRPDTKRRLGRRVRVSGWPASVRTANGRHAKAAPPFGGQTGIRTDAAFRVAIVLHTTMSDWAQRQIAGIEAGLRRAGAVVVDVVDCGYDAETQIAAIERLVQLKPDAVISIPVGGTEVAEAFRKFAAAGIKLVLLDNAPSGLLQEIEYVSVVSSDNFGLGQIAARLLSPHIPQNGSVCVVAYNIDFFATAQREIAFDKWMRRERPDITLTQLKFEIPGRCRQYVGPYLDQPSRSRRTVCRLGRACGCIFAGYGRSIPASCDDDRGSRQRDRGSAIGRAIVKGVAAQRPFEQGEIAATAVIVALTGNAAPPWIVLPGLAVSAENVAEAYKHVGGAPASSELMAFRRRS